MRHSLLYLLATLVVFSNLVRADEPPLRVAITPDSLRFEWQPRAGTTEIRELLLHTSAAGEGRVLWSGEGADGSYNQSQMQDVLNKLDELINALGR